MRALDPEKVAWIVLHTAAYDGDCSAAMIRRWHVEERGWGDIGYHFVVRQDGTIEPGRSTAFQGAHVYGINGRSVGICFSGDGDKHPWTEAQKAAGLALVQGLLRKYDLTLSAVIGHREINDLVLDGLVPSVLDGKSVMTMKTCPGRLVDMDQVRKELPLIPPYQPQVVS